MNACINPGSVKGGAPGSTTCADGTITSGGIGGPGGLPGDGGVGNGQSGNDGQPLPSPNPKNNGLGGAGADATDACLDGTKGAAGTNGNAGNAEAPLRSTPMDRYLSNLLAAAVLCTHAMAFAQAPQSGPRASATSGSPRVQESADSLFNQGAAAYDAGRLPEAEQKLARAWALKKTHDIAGNLGVVEFKLGRFAQAAEHLTWALQHFPPTESDQSRRGFEVQLAKARLQSGTLRIRLNVDGAEVSVNGRPTGTTTLPIEAFVEPGATTIGVRRKGYVPLQQTLVVAKGETRELSLTLQPAEVEQRSIVPGVVLGSIASVALATGIGLFTVGRAKASSAHDVHDAILGAGHSCVPGAANYDARCSDLSSSTSTSNTFQSAGVGLLVGAGAAALGTVIYFVWPAANANTSGSGAIRVVPSFSPFAAGLGFSGTF